MRFWQIMNYVAWAAAGLIYFWLIKDFLKTNREYSEDILLGSYEEENIEVPVQEGGSS